MLDLLECDHSDLEYATSRHNKHSVDSDSETNETGSVVLFSAVVAVDHGINPS